jgi:hypothetical protein
MIPPISPSDVAPGFLGRLEEASLRCRQTAKSWAEKMSEDDFQQLVHAFYLAESLARYALYEAVEQVEPGYREELMEQIEDENRHVDLFDRWGKGFEAPPAPRPRERDGFVWFVILLLNELAGYCQFSMLYALLGTSEQKHDIEVTILDEQRHIERLLRWTEEVWPSRRGILARRIVEAFQNKLPGRMCQFFPRTELEGLRGEMAEHISWLLEDLLEDEVT